MQLWAFDKQISHLSYSQVQFKMGPMKEASFSVTFSVMAKKTVHKTLKMIYEKNMEKHT